MKLAHQNSKNAAAEATKAAIMQHDVETLLARQAAVEMLTSRWLPWIDGLVLCVCAVVLAMVAASWLPRNTQQPIAISVPLLQESQHGPATEETAARLQPEDSFTAGAVTLQTEDSCAASAEEAWLPEAKGSIQIIFSGDGSNAASAIETGSESKQKQ